jgi:hypothetical protein
MISRFRYRTWPSQLRTPAGALAATAVATLLASPRAIAAAPEPASTASTASTEVPPPAGLPIDRGEPTAPSPLVIAARSTKAVRRAGPIAIDGRLTDPSWAQAPAASEFRQREPHEGAPARFRTEFRVLYDDRALYVGVRAYDPQPDQIRSLLHRRDQDSASDWISVAIDSYHDRRTGFSFWLTPAGVQRDLLFFDDYMEDTTWNAVWEGAAAVDRDGWVAEFRIPYNQLRFADAPEQTWGLQVARVVQRTREISFWSPMPLGMARMVSLFGTVEGIREIPPARRIELVPYTVLGTRLARIDDRDPFRDDVSPEAGVGVDFSYGLTSDLTLSGTINPDFGQVEADPSEVNLSAQETFFQEKRPFFLEGADIFRYSLAQGDGDGAVEQLFYSRRIGAPPHASAVDDAPYVEEDPTTTIYGAGKLSGKTAGGWSLGALTAVTGEERARLETETGERMERVIEPLASYTVLRLRRDFNEGRTNVGLAATGVHRALDGTELDSLHDRAYAGGLQLEHRFHDAEWMLNLRLLGSHVHGSPEAIAETQRADQRYYQRPDATHLDYDPTRTSLTGVALMGDIWRLGGKHWRTAVGFDARTPGFEVNDLGFQRNADYIINWVWGSYRDDAPGNLLRRYQLNLNGFTYSNWSPQNTANGGNVNANWTLMNYWGGNLGVALNVDRLDTKLLRGGPAVASNVNTSGWVNLFSDGRRMLRGDAGGSWFAVPATESWSLHGYSSVTLQARSDLDVSVGPFVSRRVDDTQYVDAFAVDGAPGGSRYLLARIDQTTVGLTLRLNYTMSPRLSLQVYAQPFLGAGRYREYKEPAELRALDPDARFEELDGDQIREIDGELAIDRDRDGQIDYRADRPDFNVRELRSNVVVRWEYRPGSTLFVIWSHDRSASDDDGRFRIGPELGDLARIAGEHVLLLKLTYWWGV